MGAVSDERTGLSFIYAAGPLQRRLSRVLVPWCSRPNFTVSDLRLPFSSPPTTRRVTVEVFETASTRVWISGFAESESHCDWRLASLYIDSGRTTAQKTHFAWQWIYGNPNRKHLLRHRFYCCLRVLRTLPRNGSTLFLVPYSLRACLPSRSLAMGLYVTV
jgi:hypothetical protein